MPTSKSCATVAAIHKTSHSTTHEFFCACKFSCADAESTSPQCLPAHAANARKKHSPPDTAAAPTTYSPNSTSTPPTPKRKYIRSTRVTNVLSAAGQRLTAAATSAALRTRSDDARFHNQRWRYGES